MYKCLSCDGAEFEPGQVSAKGLTSTVFTPDDASAWNRWGALGADIKASVCRRCGFVMMFADLDKLEEMVGSGETRCRKCRHILKGLTQPRCPECGESI
jgi:hypothetical protein